MARSYTEAGRVNQKRRTRAAILAAAASLLEAGTVPSVAEAADAASVSRATAYRYFPSQEHLLQELTLDIAARDIDATVTALPEQSTPAERLDAVVLAVFRLVSSNDLAFRAMLRLSLDSSAAVDRGAEPRRGGRRLRWLATALAPVREHVDATEFERLIAALALYTGIETQIVLRDVCALDEQTAADVTRWAARALLEAVRRND